MKKYVITFLTAICLSITLTPAPSFAQMSVGVFYKSKKNKNETPIGGVAMLAALGGGYAIKKLKDRKCKE